MRAEPPTPSTTTPEPRDAVDVAATEPDWRVVIALRWQALAMEVLGVGSGPRRSLHKLGIECMGLAAVAAWFECHGNVSYAAARVGVSRRTYRDRLKAWRRLHRDFELPLPDVERRSHFRRAKTQSATTSPGTLSHAAPRDHI